MSVPRNALRRGAAAPAPAWQGRLTRALLGASLLVALGGALAWEAQRPRFDFRRIAVEGDLRHVSRAAIRAAIAGHLAGNFFTMRLADARAAFEAIPWVERAAVRRVWPDRLVVHLQERRAIGVWSDGRVLSDRGQLFDGNPEEAQLDGAQIEFGGPARYAADVVARLPELCGALAAMQASVGAVEISERASWTVRTTAGLALDLGRDEPSGAVAERLRAVARSYPTVLAQFNGPPGRIDARYDNGFAAAKP